MNTARNKAVVIVVLLFASFLVITTKFRVSTDLNLFLPEPQTKFEQLLRHQLDNGASTNIVFLGFSGLPAKELAQFNIAMAKRLEQSPTFSKVTNNASTLSDEALTFLENNRYLLTHNDLDQQFSIEGFSQSLQQRLQGLSSASAPMEKKYLRNDPTGEVISLLTEWQGKISKHKRPEERHGVWFSQDHQRSLILVEIAKDISKMKNQIEAVTEIRNIFEQIKSPSIQVVMAGPAVFAVESGEDIKEDVRYLTLVAVVLVVLFLLAVYRSIKMVFLVVCPLAVGVIAATATILMLYGQIHGITLAFGITLAGVAVDYPIHLMTGLGTNLGQNEQRISKIWKTLSIGVFSTIIAYAAFLLSGFGGLQQLGLFTIVGLTVAALFSRWVLPYLAITRKDINSGLQQFHQLLKGFGKNASKVRFVVLTALVVSVLAMVFSNRPVLHLNVDSLSPISDQRRAEGKMLRGDLGFWYGGSLMVATANSKEEVLQYSEFLSPYLDDLVDQGIIEGYDMASHFLPSQQRQNQRIAQLSDIAAIRANLDQALADFPFKANVFDPFIDDLQQSKSLKAVTPTSLTETAVGKKLNPLLFDINGESGGVILLHGVGDSSAMEQFANEHDGLYYLHLKTASTELVARSVDRVSKSILGCLLIIYLALFYSFKCPLRPFRIMVPTISAAVTAAAILVFTGNPLSIFHLISLLLVVGLGLDYALFFNRLPDHNDEWDTTFKALWVCGITTILVFGILTFSSTPPLKSIGTTVGLGAFVSMIFAAMWATKSNQKSSQVLQ